MNKKREGDKKIGITSIDVFIIILVLCCIASFTLRAFVFKNEAPKSVGEEYIISFKAENVRGSSLAYFVTGDTARIGSAGHILGVLDGEIFHTLSVGEYNDSGEVLYPNINADDPMDETRVDVSGSFTAHGKETDKGFLLDSGVYVFAGSEIHIFTEHLELTVKIMNITKK